MEASNPPVLPTSSSPAPAMPTIRPKAKATSKKTKADIEAELAEARAEIGQLRAHMTNSEMHLRQLRHRETTIRNEIQRLREAEELLNWAFEQQEAVLVEAVEKGVELAHAVLEQRHIYELEFNRRWRIQSQVGDSSEDEPVSP